MPESAVDEFLSILSEGEMYSLREMAEKLNLNIEEATQIASFWAKYGFIDFDKDRGIVKINVKAQRMLLSETEEKAAELETSVLIVRGKIRTLSRGKNELKIDGKDLLVEWPGDERILLYATHEPFPLYLQIIKLLLKDFNWHSINELAESLGIPQRDLIFILQTMESVGIVNISEKMDKVKISAIDISK